MTKAKRRRGGQPGNQNALKHGLYRGKSTPGQRACGKQPYHLNRLLQGYYSALRLPAAIRPAPAHPPDAPAPCDRTVTDPPTASIADVLPLIEQEWRYLDDDIRCTPAERVIRLQQLNDLLYTLLHSRPATPPSKPFTPERNPNP